MRLFHTVAALLSFGSTFAKRVTRDDKLEGYISVFETYGNLTSAARAANSRMAVAAHEHAAMSGLRARSDMTAFKSLRTPDNCIFPLDVLILQDLSGSHQGDFRETILKTLPSIAATLPLQHPGSLFSLVTYRDKPVNELGEVEDDCFTVQSLNEEDPMDLEAYLLAEEAGGGWDYPENQYGGLLAALKSPKTIGWRTNPKATPVIIHITDSEPHYEGDGRQSLYPQLAPWGADYDEDLADEYCNNRYYPAPNVVQQAILESGVYVSHIIVRPEWQSGRALAAWTWFNELVGFPSEFVQALEDSMDNWFGEFSEILTEIMELECGEETTSTEPAQRTTKELTVDPAGTDVPITRPRTTTSTSTTTTTTSTEAEGTVAPPPTEDCSCPEGEEGCCDRQPEVLIAILKRPKVLDIHLQGYADVPTSAA